MKINFYLKIKSKFLLIYYINVLYFIINKFIFLNIKLIIKLFIIKFIK